MSEILVQTLADKLIQDLGVMYLLSFGREEETSSSFVLESRKLNAASYTTNKCSGSINDCMKGWRQPVCVISPGNAETPDQIPQASYVLCFSRAHGYLPSLPADSRDQDSLFSLSRVSGSKMWCLMNLLKEKNDHNEQEKKPLTGVVWEYHKNGKEANCMYVQVTATGL